MHISQSQTKTTHNHPIAEFLQEVVREAGSRVLEIAKNGFDVSIKPDSSQVTTADLEVDRMLKERLLSKYPHDGWLSEESPDDRKRLEKSRVWILDPIDGTRNFISKIPQYAISIALVENQELTLSVIFNPATNEMFSAVKGEGAYLNGIPIHVKDTQTDHLHCLANASEAQRTKLELIEPAITCQAFGSIAYALALQAAGRVDMTLNPGGQHEWDIAAGVLLIQEAGGTVADRNWQPIPFNQSNTTTQGVIATRPDKVSTVRQLLGVLQSP
ncbi:MAG: 3'(2'),5'-bisphosphate nucleotidase CysQ [Nitrospirales bacterium]|nr:MAG: 3'(2'),5'-bisphosphate nucleotidase CysQ [Nitrospirales bacterium]